MNPEPSHPGLGSLTPKPTHYVPTRDNSYNRRFDPARSSIEDRLKQRQRAGEHQNYSSMPPTPRIMNDPDRKGGFPWLYGNLPEHVPKVGPSQLTSDPVLGPVAWPGEDKTIDNLARIGRF